MKQVRGFWLPEGEQHLVSFLEKGPEYAGGPTYQFHKLQEAMKFVKEHDLAIDVGGHCGLWSRPLSKMFKEVIAFEPVSEHRECFTLNLQNEKNWLLYPYALGNKASSVTLHSGPASSGDTYVQEGGEHAAEMQTLDSFGIHHVDFLKIDCEGFEFYVLQGGENTIRRDRPCIIVEQKPNKGKQFGLGDRDAVDLLKSWGAVVRKEISGDFVMSWD